MTVMSQGREEGLGRGVGDRDPELGGRWHAAGIGARLGVAGHGDVALLDASHINLDVAITLPRMGDIGR